MEYMDEKSFNQLVEYYEDEQNYAKAIDVVSVALLQYEYRSDYYIAMSRLLLKCNKADESLDFIKRAESIAPYEHEIFILKAKALAIKGHFSEALDVLKNANPFLNKYDRVEYYLGEAFVYEAMKSHADMYQSLSRVLMIEGDNEEALDSIIKAAQASKQIDQCIELHKRLLDINPYNYLAWYNLGIAYTHKGEYVSSIDALEYSFIIENEFEEGYMDCADVCCQIKRYDQAANIYEEAIGIFGEDADLLTNLAECLINLNEISKAKHQLYKAVKIDPYNDEVLYFLGECFSKEQKWYRAINAYHKAIDLEQDCENYYLSLARAYLAVEEYNKATINFQQAISFGPEQTFYWKEFATFMIRMGLYEEALAILDESDDFTYGADLQYCRGVAHLFLKNQDTAMSYFEEALLESFDDHNIIFELAPELEVSREIKAMINYFSKI